MYRVDFAESFTLNLDGVKTSLQEKYPDSKEIKINKIDYKESRIRIEDNKKLSEFAHSAVVALNFGTAAQHPLANAVQGSLNTKTITMESVSSYFGGDANIPDEVKKYFSEGTTFATVTNLIEELNKWGTPIVSSRLSAITTTKELPYDAISFNLRIRLNQNVTVVVGK